jgi:hypothetical protein
VLEKNDSMPMLGKNVLETAWGFTTEELVNVGERIMLLLGFWKH